MQYINSAIRTLCLIAGAAVFGILTLTLHLFGVRTPWAWGMIFGSVIAIALAVILGLLSRREYLKLMEAHSRVGGRVIDFVLATVRAEGLSRRGYVFLTEEQICMFLWDKRPYLETTVKREEVTVRYSAGQPNRLVLGMNEDEMIELYSGAAGHLFGIMRENGYQVEGD